MSEVTIYTTMFCPFCWRAKKLLGEKGVAFDEIDVGFSRGARQDMMEKAGGSHTVPQIFIGKTHVGGYDELAAMELNGRLDPLLQAG